MPKSKTRKLNDTQLVILSSASQREDGLAVLPEGMRAASVKAAVIRLSKLGFLKQVRIKRDQPHWLTDEGGHADRAAEFGRRARITPRPQGIFDFPAERTGFVCRRERCCRGTAG